jgi:hypothetical protein
MILRLESKWAWIPFGILLILVATYHFADTTSESLRLPIFIFDFLILFGIVLPTGVASAFRSRNTFVDRIIHVDFLISVVAIGFCIENLRSPGSPLPLAAACFVGFAWMQWRLWLGRYWDRKTKDFFRNPDLLWQDSLIPWLRHQRYLAAAGLFLLLAAVLYAIFRCPTRNYFWTSFAACFLPCAFPYFEWIALRLRIESEKVGFLCRSFESFKKLKDYQMILMHRFGVLTLTKFKIADYFIDDSDEWSEAEIKELISLMVANSLHPASKILIEEFKPKKKSLVSLESIQARPHLGLISEFHDLQGRKGTAVLGEMTWHKILQHEIFPEHLDKLKQLNEKADLLVLISMNRKILAAIAISAPEKENLADLLGDFNREGIKIALLSSSPLRSKTVTTNMFVETATNLLPLERQTQRKVWMERVQPILEVKSYWDSPETPNLPALIFADKADQSPEAECMIIGKNIDALHRAIHLSSNYQKKIFAFNILALGITIGLLVALSLGCVHK